MVSLNKKDKETERKIKEIVKYINEGLSRLNKGKLSLIQAEAYKDCLFKIIEQFPEYFKESD